MGKYELCKHTGEKITDGKELNRLKFCVECGSPILKTVFDLIAYLKTPRILQDGKVKKLRWNIYKKIEISLSYTHLIMRIVGREGKRGRPRGDEIDVSEIDLAERGKGWWEWAPSIMKIGEGEEGEKLPHHEPAPNKFGWGGGPGRTYRLYYQWAVEAEKKWRQMREVLKKVQKKLNEKGVNKAVDWWIFKTIVNGPDLPYNITVYRPYEVYLEKEEGKPKIILIGEPEKSLIQAYVFIIYLSTLLLSLPKRSIMTVCAASLMNTGCSVNEVREITGVGNIKRIYYFRGLLEKVNRLMRQDERLLKGPKPPLDKKIIVKRGKDGKIRVFKQW